MTPDEIIQEIFKIQQERNPDSDPGDMTITVQDDMPLVNVAQHLWESDYADKSFSEFIMLAQGVFGRTLEEALNNFLTEVKEGIR